MTSDMTLRELCGFPLLHVVFFLTVAVAFSPEKYPKFGSRFAAAGRVLSFGRWCLLLKSPSRWWSYA